jgi:hypothetical protein
MQSSSQSRNVTVSCMQGKEHAYNDSNKTSSWSRNITVPCMQGKGHADNASKSNLYTINTVQSKNVTVPCQAYGHADNTSNSRLYTYYH